MVKIHSAKIAKFILYEAQQEEHILLMLVGRRNEDSDNATS